MKDKPLLHLQLTFKNLVIFLFFFLLMHELHELAHIITGRIICGCWGTRDFNVWNTCSNCANPITVLAVFAGPIFTFTMLWLGRFWIKYGRSAAYRSLGLVLVLGNMQFGRIYMAAMGSGDEIAGFRTLFLNANHSNALTIRIITTLIIAAICIPPLVSAYKAIANKSKLLIYTGFLLVPLILDTLILLMFLNGLLMKGILNQVWIMGTPLFITLWFIGCAIVLTINFKSLMRFAKPKIDG